MCYKQLRKYIYFFIFCFFACIFLAFQKLELNENNASLFGTTSPQKKELQIPETQKFFCGINLEELKKNTDYPECLDRLNWLKGGWKSHECYAKYGVDGSDCSFYDYMTKREQFCPKFQNLPENLPERHENLVGSNPKIDLLFNIMNDSVENYEFIQTRIQRLWPKWLEAREQLIGNKTIVASRKAKNVFLYLGFLNIGKGMSSFVHSSKRGGPLGELVQWSDLIASIYTLGHSNMQIFTKWTSAKSALLQYQKSANNGPCPMEGGKNDSIDLIFTDIMGLLQIKRQIKSFYVDNWCRFRVLDSFGTHAEFNQPQYFRSNYKKYGTKIKSNPWGGNALNLQQFLTLYPHTDDNTFLGFVVETHPIDKTIQRENITLVYAKEAYMWKNCSSILEIAAKYTKIHATVENYEAAVGHSHMEFENHGILNSLVFNQLLQRSKVFLGLGFPIEGPAPLEAIANGAVFIQPKFDPPKSRITYKFFSEKPTMRKITSQNPYMERFVGSPYVITVDINNAEELSNAYEQALRLAPTPTLPYEFSFLGMLERVDAILTNLNFCAKNSNWPPFEKVGHVILGKTGQSCQNVCSENGFLCERSFFKRINTEEMLQRHGCSEINRIAEPIAPSICSLQTDPYLFSCATEPPSDIKRLCPCRTFKKNQTILCDIC